MNQIHSEMNDMAVISPQYDDFGFRQNLPVIGGDFAQFQADQQRLSAPVGPEKALALPSYEEARRAEVKPQNGGHQ